MKRDMDLIRKIVIAVEDAPTGFAPPTLAVDGYTREQIGYHAYLLIDAGFAAGHDFTGMGDDGPIATLTHLTWTGHEFAAAARDDSRWSEAMQMVKAKGGTVTIGVLTQLLGGLMKHTFGLS